MATLYEYYNTGDDADFAINNPDWWMGQTFTPATAHKITSIKVKINKVGSPSGDLNCHIRATDADGHPTGDDLCSGSIAFSSIGTSPAWYEFTLGDGANLDADTQYAFILEADGVDTGNYLQYRVDNSSPTYAGGCREYSTDNDSTWSSSETADWMFEDWGEAIAAVGRSFGFIFG